MFTVSAYSLLLRSAPSEQRGQATGLFTGGFLVGGITGPALGGVISEISIRAPFFLYAGTLAVAGSIGLFLLPRAELGEKAAGRAPSASLGTAARSPAYRAALAAQFADSWTMLGVRAALVPLFVTDASSAGGLGLGRIWVGVGFGVVAALNAVVLLPAGRFADRRGRRPPLLLGTLLSTIGLAMLATASGLVVYLLALVVLGLGAGFLDVAPGAIVGDTVTALPATTTDPVTASATSTDPVTASATATDPVTASATSTDSGTTKTGRGGTIVAAFQMTGDLGSVLGPLAAGRLADGAGYGAAFGLTAGVSGLALLLAVFAPETRRPADRAAQS
jgi:MFS family permease